MIATLTRLYKLHGEAVLIAAVAKSWITEDEKAEIIESSKTE
jgi:hypothetical protein